MLNRKLKNIWPLIIFCMLFLFNTNVFAVVNITLAWDATTTNTDESTIDDLDGYIIYYGTNSGEYTQYIDVGNVTAYQITGLTEGYTYYFSITAYNESDVESDYATEISQYIEVSSNGPDITVSDSVSPVNDQQIPFGNVTEGTTSNQTVTVTNDGDSDLIIGNIAQNNVLAAPFSVTNDNCSGQTVSPLSSCTVTVRFSPSTTGTFSDSFDIPSNDPDENSVTVSVSGTGEALPVPDITVTESVSPTNNQQIPFGNVTESSSSSETVTVTNDGNADLIIGNIAQNNALAAPFSVTSDNCSGQTVSPSSSCTVTVRFSPLATGTFSDSFDIPSNDPDENSVTVSVSGTGAALPVPDITVTDSVSPTNNQQIPFGNVTESSSSSETVTVTNDGNADLTIGNVAQTNALAAPFSITSDTCSGQTVSPSSSCTVTVRFVPSTTGTFSDSFDIPSNDPDENSVTVSVSGTGEALPVPDITVTDSVSPFSDHQVPFEDLTEGLTLDKEITIANNGSAEMNVGNIAQNNPIVLPFSIVNDTCSGQTIGESSNCTLTVRFSPDTIGVFNDSFDIPSNDPDENSITIAISGTGLSAITNNPPTVPNLVYPANGQQGVGETVDFQWEESTDPDKDPITYYLYYAEDGDFSGITPIMIASLKNNEVQYAGIGSFQNITSVIIMIILFSLIAGIAKNKKRTSLLILVFVMAGLLLISCGEIEDLIEDTIPFGGSGGGSVSRVVNGFASGGSYCWKVVADDGGGGESESDTNCFGT